MILDTLKGGRLAALFLAGLVLFNYPILSLFNLDITLMGMPLLYLYIFGCWCLIIGLMILITDTGRETSPGDAEAYRD